ncbi:MAG: CRISPR-associated protein Cas4 [Anaerolineae bacterium]
MFTVTDLKQYTYCARIVYYHHCLPAIRPVTYKMEAGAEAGEDEELRELRRSLRPYGLKRGERHLDVYLSSDGWGLRGRVDLVIDTDDNPRGERELIPVDFKLSPGRMGANLRLQLMAYGVILEEAWGLPARRGFVYFIPQRRAVEVPFTPELRVRLEASLRAMRDIVERERMPPPPRQRARCEVCEFRRFCNDV